MSDNLYDRVRYGREAFEVERCHTHPHALRYSVGHHSAGVASLVIQTWLEEFGELPRAELITAALDHDKPELVTGDIPSPSKTLMGTRALGTVENRVLGWLTPGLHISLTGREQEWLEAADAMELYLWCMEEVYLRGNRVFASWLDHYDGKWTFNPPPAPFKKIQANANRERGMRLPWPQLKEIAGL